MTRTEVEDRTLAQRVVKSRDEFAFRTLYRRHTPALFALALRLCGGRLEAEELVQDAWVRAVERLAHFRWEAALRTWLSSILINCYRERIRANQRSLTLELHDGGMDTPDGEIALVDRLALEDAIASLPDGYREVLVLHDVEGYRHREIADALGIQEGTSKSQLARGRALLRQRLAPPNEMEKGGRS